MIFEVWSKRSIPPNVLLLTVDWLKEEGGFLQAASSVSCFSEPWNCRMGPGSFTSKSESPQEAKADGRTWRIKVGSRSLKA